MLESRRDGPDLYVRVNALDTGMTLSDLAATMPAAPNGIVLPKCRGRDESAIYLYGSMLLKPAPD